MSGGTGAERLTTERSSRTWSSLASRTESRHLLLGGAGAVLGALVGLLALSGTTPLAGEDSIREIIPFPMNKNAQDLMMGAPGEVTQKQLDELHIAIVKDEEQ